MTRVSANLTQMFPDFNTGWTSRVVPLREELTGDVRPALLVLGARWPLLPHCLRQRCQPPARAGNRTTPRARGPRRAGRRTRAAGAPVAGREPRPLWHRRRVRTSARVVGARFLRAVVAERLLSSASNWSGSTPRSSCSRPVSLLCGFVFGIIPALTASGNSLTDALKEGGRTGSAARGNRTRSAFVVVEVALALVLLVGAAFWCAASSACSSKVRDSIPAAR